MKIMEIICNAIFNILNIYIEYRVFEIFLERKSRPAIIRRFVWTGVWGINYIIYAVIGNIYVTTVSLVVLLLVTAIWLYEGSWLQYVVVIALIVLLGMAVEDITWRVLSYYDLLRYGESIGTLAASVLIMLIVVGMERIFSFQKGKYIPKESYFNIMIVLIGNIVLMYLLAEMSSDLNTVTLLALSIIGAIDISTFYLYDKVNEGYQQRMERCILEERISMYDNQLKIVQQGQESLNAVRHDLRNHILLVNNYIIDGEYNRAVEYLGNIQKVMHTTAQYVNTGNRDVDVILNYALDRAQRLGCKVEKRIVLPSNSFMSGYDLNVLLSNLLDNALEALEQADNRILCIDMHYDRGILLLRIENTFDGVIKTRDGRYATRKKNPELHGIGIKNIQKIVEKYNGEQKIIVKDQRFRTDVILYILENVGI